MRAYGEMGWIVDSSPTGLTWHIGSLLIQVFWLWLTDVCKYVCTYMTDTSDFFECGM